MAYVVRVQYVGGTVRQKAVVPALLGCYQEVAITDTDADDTSLCAATAVELMSFRACGRDGAAEVSWETGSELHNLGFHLYRSESASGPWVRLTGSLIPGLGSSPLGQSYSYRDPGLENGTRYYYELEDVETTGDIRRHGPVWAEPAAGATTGTCGGQGVLPAPPTGAPPEAASTPTVSLPAALEEREVYGSPRGTSLRVVERGPSHAVIELRTRGFFGVRERDGTLRLEAPGFRLGGDPTAPAVPVRDAVVGIPAGRGVHVASVEARDVVRFDHLVLAGTGEPDLEVGPGGVVRAGRTPRRAQPPAAGNPLYPSGWTGGVETLFQGARKKARLSLAPMRYDAREQAVFLARRLVVRLEFRGRAAGERALPGARGRRWPSPPVPPDRGVFARLTTGAPGLYGVRFEDVLGPGARALPLARLRLSRGGNAVPFHVEPDRGIFAPGSTLYFVGGGDRNPWGEAVYELARGQGGLRMPTVGAAPSGVLVEEYESAAAFEENRIYQPGLLEAPDLWLWENIISPGERTHAFDAPGLTPSLAPARIQVWLQGGSDFEGPDHHIRLSVNGTAVAEASWDGRTERVIEVELAPGLLVESGNTLTLENVGDLVAYSLVFLNRFEVSWPRVPVTADGTLVGRFDRSGQVEVAGLGGTSALSVPASRSAQGARRAPAFVVDTTDGATWRRGVVATTGGAAFPVEEGHRYLATTGPLLPAVRRASPSQLSRVTNRAEWLVVAPRALAPAARPLVKARQDQGLVARLVTLEEIDDAFGYGEKSPAGLKRFLEYVYQEWSPPTLRYVVLLGDSTTDPRHNLGPGPSSPVFHLPLKTSYLWTASDPTFGAVNGEDLVPDVVVGRLPAATLEEAKLLVEKILAFEGDGRTPSGRAVLVADNPDSAGDFEADQDEIAEVLDRRQVDRISLRALGAPGTRAEILWAFESGAGLLSYVGHGGTAVWASENVLNTTDVPGLAPQAEQPLVLTMNCLNGYFVSPTVESLAESLVRAEGKGAIATFSPSGLAPNEPVQAYYRALVEEIESGRHARLGDALLAAQSDYADAGALPEVLSIYHLFGDPALRLR